MIDQEKWHYLPNKVEDHHYDVIAYLIVTLGKVV